MRRTNVKRVSGSAGSLTDVVFSWSLANVLDENHHKVPRIPLEFKSMPFYMRSFIPPLLEEIRADLSMSLKAAFEDSPCDPQQLSVREIKFVEESNGYKLPKNLFYNISLNGIRVAENDKTIAYEPSDGDIIALTDLRPDSIDDSKRSERSYTIALVQGSSIDSDQFQIVSSKPVEFEHNVQDDGKRNTLYVVFLINLTTNICIWNSLSQGLQGGNMQMIQKVLQPKSFAGGRCKICSSGSSESVSRIDSFELNESQRTAVLSCIATAKCHHQNSVELIKGPPGTGKTKTVSALLHALLGMKCRTLSCAPTNIAVLEVAERVLSLIQDSPEYGDYGLGDIVLFGSSEGMQIDEGSNLCKISLDTRANILAQCFSRSSGWKHSLDSMICLLEETMVDCVSFMEDGTNTHTNGQKKKKKHEKGELGNEKLEVSKEKEEFQCFKDPKSKKVLKAVSGQTSKGNKNKEKQSDISSPGTNKLKYGEKQKNELAQTENDRVATGEHHDFQMPEDFVGMFDLIGKQLKLLTEDLCTHLPTSVISLEVVKDMVKALDFLKQLQEILHECKDAGKRADLLPKLHSAREEFLQILKCLREKLTLPKFYAEHKIKKFCLEKACLLFCTASSSVKLKMKGMTPVELLVIDEAAQLKECESTIPLQIPGLRHAILVGDEMQLPALVKSKISEKAEFGRSLFERLVLLEHEYHLLNVQYRMHPSISFFPNKEFYENLIFDAPNVKERSYGKQFLHGSIYAPYSFVNVPYGKEEFDKNHSSRNMVEVAVVCEVITGLFNESVSRKQKVSVGVISPYKAQVSEIQEKLGKICDTDETDDFSVKVCTVDGFQGGEEDVIIISTVRGNERGKVGFLHKRQRANVSLTRARHCLWIFGDSRTLVDSGTVWKKVVTDAKERRCFYNASEEKNLAQAMAIALIERCQHEDIPHITSLLFRTARWKVYFSDEFWESIFNILDTEVLRQVVFLLEKLSRGWRLKGRNHYIMHGTHLVQYMIRGNFNLLWSVDIFEAESSCIQVLKIYDVVSSHETSRAVRQLCSIFKDYTEDRIQRCQFKLFEGKLEVPMTWPINHNGCSVEVSNSFASLSLDD